MCHGLLTISTCFPKKKKKIKEGKGLMAIGGSVIDTGTFVKHFMESALNQSDGSKFIGICSRSIEKTEAFAKGFRAKHVSMTH